MDEATKKIVLMLLTQGNEGQSQLPSGSSRGGGSHQNSRGRGGWRGGWRGNWRGRGQGQRQPFYTRSQYLQPYNYGHFEQYRYEQPIYGCNPHFPPSYYPYMPPPPPPPLPPIYYSLTVNPPLQAPAQEEVASEVQKVPGEKGTEGSG